MKRERFMNVVDFIAWCQATESTLEAQGYVVALTECRASGVLVAAYMDIENAHNMGRVTFREAGQSDFEVRCHART